MPQRRRRDRLERGDGALRLGRGPLGPGRAARTHHDALEDRACLKCHAADVRGTRSAEETDRYHELADHRSVRTPCVACHVTHRAGKPERTFLDDAVVRRQCASCHRRLDDAGG